jgi:hypothetical protein
MKTNHFLMAAGVSLAITFTLSCSDSSGDNPPTVKKAKISGVFQKGPFVEGTSATLNELDSDLNPTGRPYQTLITDDKGSFELRNVELVSPYVHLIANGFYRNEVTGRKSDAQITLQAIVDVTDKDNANVNILTHLEYYRVLDLVDGGMTLKAAKKQAQREILAAFGIASDNFKDSEDMTIFGTSESDAALLAVSILLLGDLSDAEFSSRLMNFSQAIRNGGAWNDKGAKAEMVDWASLTGTQWIKNNILSWGLSAEVPAFEKYVQDYWTSDLESKLSGNEACEAPIFDCSMLESWGIEIPNGTPTLITTIQKNSLENGYVFLCKDGFWKLETETTYGFFDSKECGYTGLGKNGFVYFF